MLNEETIPALVRLECFIRREKHNSFISNESSTSMKAILICQYCIIQTMKNRILEICWSLVCTFKLLLSPNIYTVFVLDYFPFKSVILYTIRSGIRLRGV